MKTEWAKVKEQFRPYVEESDQWVTAAMAEVANTSGQPCGPIASLGLISSAWQMAYARFWLAQASSDPEAGIKVRDASKLLDSARQNAQESLKTAVAIARSQPKEIADPLAAFMEPDGG